MYFLVSRKRPKHSNKKDKVKSKNKKNATKSLVKYHNDAD